MVTDLAGLFFFFLFLCLVCFAFKHGAFFCLPQRRRLPFAVSRCPPKFYFAGTSWLVLFSLLLLPLLPLLIVAPSLNGCNFLGYLPGSNGVFDYCLLPPGPALSLAPCCHYQLGVFLCLGLAFGSVFMNGGWAASRRASAGFFCPCTHLFPVRPLPRTATAAAQQWARRQEGQSHLPTLAWASGQAREVFPGADNCITETSWLSWFRAASSPQ